jgi:hypothetical protein
LPLSLGAFNVRTFIRAALASVIALLVVVGPVSAATTQAVTVAQATQSGTIAGTVTGDSGNGLGGASVLVDGAGQHLAATTDSTGSFTFNVAPGVYDVTVTHGGYQTATASVTVTSGTSVTATIAMTAASLNNLNVIGRTSSVNSGNAAKFNVSSETTQTLSQSQILARNTPDLTQVVNELPGITIPHATSNPNQSFIIRGMRYETKTELDGHPVSSGTGGTFLTNYTAAAIFGGVDVLKGQGLNGPTSGEAGAGIVNLRTPDFTSKDTGFLQGGVDSYGGTIYTALASINLLKDNKLSFVFGRAFSGYRGPTYGTQEPDYTGAFINASTNNQIPNLANGVVQYINDFSNTYSLNAELAKMRYKFSDATSLSAEFVGFQGRYNPQGGAYGQFAGYLTVPQCLTGGKAAAGAACTVTSEYGTPQSASLLGQTVPVYAFYPGSFVEQNQPNFSAEFKTTFKNDTIQFRPYTAAINRLIDGTQENTIPGDNGGGWAEVTNSANCQVSYVLPSVANGGAKGPCYAAGATPIAAYVNDPNTPHVYNATGAALVCTATTPCFTTSTGINNSGQVGFGSPYTTLEVDHLAGYTFNYIHPVGANTYNISYDHYFDDATAFVNDASPLAPGCSFVLGSTANTPLAPGSQASCGLPTLRASPLSVPETFSSVSSLSATAQFQLTSKFELDFGGYFTHFNIQAQREDPTALAFYTALLGPSGRTSATPIILSGITNAASHFDPHFGLLFRPTKDWVIRANGGSSLSIPYASLVSGFTTASQGAASTTLSTPNFALAPEEVVSMDLGTDYRTPDGTVISGDIYNTVVHNPWISTKIQICNSLASCALALPGLEPVPLGYTSQTLNGAQQYAQGFEISVAKLPAIGFGYRVNTSFEREYYLGTPNAYFSNAAQVFFNGNQFVSSGSGQSSVPYAKAYAEVQYAGPNKSLIRFGADYEGNNNSYNAPAFWIFDAGARVNTGFHDVMLGGTVENLFNTNFGALLARGVEFQGLNPIAGTPSATGYTYSQPFNSALAAPGPITFRFTLTKQF